MTTFTLATIILLTCGTGHSDKVEDCRDKMVNCSVDHNGEITKAKVDECVKSTKE